MPEQNTSEATGPVSSPAPSTVPNRPLTRLPRALNSLKLLLRAGKSASGLMVLAIVPLFLVFANTQIKDLADRFIGGCVFVVDKRSAVNGQILVTGRIAGTMPKSVPLMFEGRDALINMILFDEEYRQDSIPEPDDLAFHPMTGLSCPGALCDDSGSAEVRRQVQIMLRDLRAEFIYRFRVWMRSDPGTPAITAQNLKVYALFDKGIEDGVCRVQPPRWFNFWVWATPLQKSLLFFGIVVVGGMLVKWAKPSGG